LWYNIVSKGENPKREVNKMLEFILGAVGAVAIVLVIVAIVLFVIAADCS
jgi:hypothetical protein